MNGVPMGVSSWVGFIAAAAAVCIPFIGELADATAPLGVPASVWVVVSAVLVVVTIIGRMWQAINLPAPAPGKRR